MRWTVTGPCQSGADGRLLIDVSVLSAITAAKKKEAGSMAAGSLQIDRNVISGGKANHKACLG